jgi:hypothetical protein
MNILGHVCHACSLDAFREEIIFPPRRRADPPVFKKNRKDSSILEI